MEVLENVLWFLGVPVFARGLVRWRGEAWRSGELFLVTSCTRTLGNSYALALSLYLVDSSIVYSAAR